MSKVLKIPNIEELNKIFTIDFNNGKIYHKTGRNKDKEINNITKGGYNRVYLNGKQYKAHRLIYCMYHGYIDESLDIDHIDRNPYNNSISNLRLVTTSINLKNVTLRKDNNSGYKGISWNKGIEKWETYINTNGKRIRLGYFTNLEDAIKVRQEAEKKNGFLQ